jgi:hypothetical protein
VPDDDLTSIFPGLDARLLDMGWTGQTGSGLATDPEHGGVTAEAIDAHIRGLVQQGRAFTPGIATSGGDVAPAHAPGAPGMFGAAGMTDVPPPPPAAPDELDEPDEPDDGSVEPDNQGEPAPAEPLSPATPAPPTDLIEIDGRQYTREQLEAFARFSSEWETDPALKQLVTAYYQGRFDVLGRQLSGQPAPAAFAPPAAAPAAYVPAAAPAAPPLTFDENDDPRVVAMFRQMEEQNRQIADLTRGLQARDASQVVQAAQTQQAIVERGARSFQEQHSLTDDEIRRLRGIAGRMGHIDVLMTGVDPITNLPARPDLLESTERALEIAMYADPYFRQRMIDAALAAQQTRNRKRQKLAGVGGSSGSVSRTATAPAPGTPAARNAMIGEVGQMLAGTWTEPGS